MKIQKFIILFIFVIISISEPLNLHFKDIRTGENFYAKKNNIDSLRYIIQRNGWSDNLLVSYQEYIINSTYNFKSEQEIISRLPGGFERTYLRALILKKELNYKEMFDSLLVCLNLKPSFYPFYDELVFSARATNQTTLLENKLELIKGLEVSQSNYIKGLINISRENYKQAFDNFQNALKTDPVNVNILFQLSYNYRSLADYDKAKTLLDKVIKLSGKNPWLTVKALIAQGSLFYLSQKTGEAKKLYLKGYDAAVRLDDRQDEAISLIDLSIIQDESGDLKTARENYLRSVKIADGISDLETKALALSELGVSFTFTNDLIEAKHNYLESYKLYKKTGNFQRLSLLSDNLGKIFTGLFNYETALKYFEDGLQYAGDNTRSQILNLLGLADAYMNSSNYAEALNYYKQAERLSAQIKDISLSADALSGLGALNYNINNYNNSLIYFSSADKLYNEAGDLFSQAEIYNKLGLAFVQLDSAAKAENYFKLSIQYAGKNKDYFNASLSSCCLIDLYIKNKRILETGRYLSFAKQGAIKSHSKYLAAIISLLSGNLSEMKKDLPGAQNGYEYALRTAKDLNDRDLEIESFYYLAKLSEEFKSNAKTEYYYISAINLIEDVSRPLFKNDKIQIAYFNSKSDVYDSYIKFLLKQKKYIEAFNIIDRSRSRNTMQNLNNLKAGELIADNSILNQLYDYDWLVHSGIYDAAKTDSINAEFNILKREQLLIHPELRKYFYYPQNLNLNDLQQVLDAKEFILSIYSTGENVYVFLISKSKFIPFVFNIPVDKLRQLISAVSPYYSDKDKGHNFYNKDLFSFNTEASYNLFKTFLKPAFDNIPENSEVIISASPELVSVPFDFLATSFNQKDSPFNYYNKDFLILHYNISYTPSAAVYLNQKENNLINNGKILLVGNPAINNRLSGYSERRGLLDDETGIPRNITLLPLKYSAEELSEISSIISSDKILTGGAATETNFKESAPFSKIIHLSTHSFLYNKQPVIFFSNSYDPNNDGFLEAGEIVKMKLNSDLVVLSSCNSGSGEIDRSEGVLGMTKAFFEAGAKSVVVSLWEVDDKYTSDLMRLFYQYLSEGFDKSQALRYAKINFIQKYSPNPYYWSAFILSGNISAIRLKTKVDTTPYIIGLLLIFGVAGTLILIISRAKK